MLSLFADASCYVQQTCDAWQWLRLRSIDCQSMNVFANQRLITRLHTAEWVALQSRPT